MQAVVINLQQEAMAVREYVMRLRIRGRWMDPLKRHTVRDIGRHDKRVQLQARQIQFAQQLVHAMLLPLHLTDLQWDMAILFNRLMGINRRTLEYMDIRHHRCERLKGLLQFLGRLFKAQHFYSKRDQKAILVMCNHLY